MKVFHRATDLQSYLSDLRTNNRSVGFVPTMGALHQGHRSLVKRSKAENQVTVVSIFVNPTQFNDAADLEKYPRTPGKDIEYLAEVGCEVVFLPTTEQVYPPDLPHKPPLKLGQLDQVMEGTMRPGHFAGVAQVVERLLELTIPDKLYMGQKDYQQLAIVRTMIQQRNLPVELVATPTIREADGLAMSSRNQRLSPEIRKHVPELYRAMQLVKNKVLAGENPEKAAARASELLNALPGLKVEYVNVFDGRSLQAYQSEEEPENILVALAVWAGDVRLIDNLYIKGS